MVTKRLTKELYFTTTTVIDWMDVFTRPLYKHIIISDHKSRRVSCPAALVYLILSYILYCLRSFLSVDLMTALSHSACSLSDSILSP